VERGRRPKRLIEELTRGAGRRKPGCGFGSIEKEGST
jgi:hypothetical protein